MFYMIGSRDYSSWASTFQQFVLWFQGQYHTRSKRLTRDKRTPSGVPINTHQPTQQLVGYSLLNNCSENTLHGQTLQLIIAEASMPNKVRFMMPTPERTLACTRPRTGRSRPSSASRLDPWACGQWLGSKN
jgi:hypothetical protein